uniref:Putative ovule protein n=1 Tax=Solanum chacoense TaxID=4108 RepID=A0A0V0HCZ6_SOLCH
MHIKRVPKIWEVVVHLNLSKVVGHLSLSKIQTNYNSKWLGKVPWITKGHYRHTIPLTVSYVTRIKEVQRYFASAKSCILFLSFSLSIFIFILKINKILSVNMLLVTHPLSFVTSSFLKPNTFDPLPHPPKLLSFANLDRA